MSVHLAFKIEKQIKKQNNKEKSLYFMQNRYHGIVQ